MCCICSGEPVEDKTGNYKTFHGQNTFQTTMLYAPCADGCNTFGWFCGQFIPFTCGCTQYFLRKKVLHNDMTKYSCFQGYLNCCCFKSGSCGEEKCPDLCLCLESCCCNSFAISASRLYVMEKYDLSSDPCDYRMIRINNALQVLACFCNILSIFVDEVRHLAVMINRIADLFYHCMSGCMTAQVAHEMNFQDKNGQAGEHITTKLAEAQYVNH